MTIVATGTKQGDLITVSIDVDNQQITIKGNNKYMHLLLLNEKLKESHAIGGTYFPPKNSALHYYNVVERYFFDELKSIETDEEIPTIPYEEGLIY